MESTSANSKLPPEDWVAEYGDYLYRYAFSRLRDANAAEEVIQETFLAGIRNLEQYRGTGSQRGWLLTILKRKIIDFVRNRNKNENLISAEDEQDPTALLFDGSGKWKDHSLRWNWDPEQPLQSQELWEIVQKCLTNLPNSQADVFVLSVMEEMDSSEICKSLDITPSNYWVRLHRARLGLAKCVDAKWFHSEKERISVQ